jgi:type IV pilus assembly protein PilB
MDGTMVDVTSLSIDSEVLKLIPKSAALELSVLPIRATEEGVVIVLPEGYHRQVRDDLAFFLGRKVIVETAAEDLLRGAIKRFYNVSEMELNQAGVAAPAEIISLQDEKHQRAFSFDGSVVNLVNQILTDAIRMGASDIHVEPYERILRVRYRLDGVLHDVLQPSLDKTRPLTSRLKIMAGIDIAEKRRPQDGRIRVKQGGRTIDIRVSTLPTDFGEKVVLRILDKSRVELDLTKLGFEESDLALFQRTIELPYGMVLVTGPTGSGKTTTLYAALSHLNRPDINITTIEDPIEYNLAGINQTHIRPEIGLTFAAALRSILRQDPDVIMLGEIRDTETAEIAVRAALTGHLVFSTLHTNDAPSAVTRLVDMGVEPFLVAPSVKLIIAQRLLRKLCDRCKQPVQPDMQLLREFGVNHIKKNVTFFGPKGCPACQGFGFQGRTAVYELVPVQNRLAELIAQKAGAGDFRAAAREEGLTSLREAALKKAERGETSFDEVIRETVVS